MPRVLGFRAPHHANPSISTQALWAMSSGSPIVICIVACPSRQLPQEQLSSDTRTGASSVGSCANARYAQVPSCNAPAGTGPSSRACDVLPSEENGFRARQTFAAPGRPPAMTLEKLSDDDRVVQDRVGSQAVIFLECQRKH